MIATDYQKQAADFLAAHGLTFSAVLIGSDCPRFCEDAAKGKDMGQVNTYPRRTHIHGKHYRCTFNRDPKANVSPSMQRHLIIDFWNSYADEEFNYLREHPRDWSPASLKLRKQPKRTPTAYDVLACVEKYEPERFEDWASSFGYDTDSRRAFETWQAAMDEWRKVSRFFTAEELEQLQEIS